jgi:glutathione S-transferase
MINPNGTIPSLTSPFLNEPLTESVDILRFLDQLSDSGVTLVPTNPIVEEKVEAILEIVHSQQVDSNIILLQARDTEELQSKQATAGAFLRNRQVKLEKEAAASPSNAFYGPKIKQNMDIYKFFALPISSDHEAFFQKTHNDYQSFAQGVNQLESILVLPYAAGETVTEADFNVIPWLSHCMAAAGTPEHEILSLDGLEKVVQKSVPNFVIGERTMQWWANVSELKAFKEAFPFLH